MKKLFIVLMTDDDDRMVQRVLLVHRHCLDRITQHAAIVVAYYCTRKTVQVTKSLRADIKLGHYFVATFIGMLSGVKLTETWGKGKKYYFDIETMGGPLVVQEGSMKRKKCSECGHTHQNKKSCGVRHTLFGVRTKTKCRCDGF